MRSLGTELRKVAETLGIEIIPPAPAIPTTAPLPTCEPWCGGLGFRRTGTTFIESGAGELRSLSEAISGIGYGYCTCPPGLAARARHEEARAALDARLAQQAVERIWADADIPPKLRRYSLESYLLLPLASADLVAKLRRWQRSSAWLLLWGDAGTCKTGLAVSLLLEHLAAGQAGLYVVAPDYLDRIRQTYAAGAGAEETDVLAAAIGATLLLLDDLGKAPLTAWGKEKLFTLMNRRDAYERRTIVTTNLNLAQLEEHVDTPTFDRIRGNACDPETGESFVIELTGESRRGLSA